MSDITDVVKALTELAAALRSAARSAETGTEATHAGYYEGKARAYHDAAGMVDAVMLGPAMQAALDQLDKQTDPDWQCIDQEAAHKLVDKLTGSNRSNPTERL